jgi:hypothetical protein
MKKLLLLFVFCMASMVMLAQKSVNFEYCSLNGSYNDKFMNNKFTVHIDFGENTKLKSDNNYNDAKGENVVFYSMIDAMNFMDKQGWELAQAYAITPTNSRSSYQWILKRKLYEETEPVKKEN